MRKAAFLLLFLLFAFNLFGQATVNNFKIVNNEILWQKVFETTSTFDQLINKAKESGLFANIEISDNKFIADLLPFAADFRGAGYTEMKAPIYIARNHFSGFFLCDYKEGRYRVTVKRIILTKKYNDPLSKQGEVSELEFYGIQKSKNEFRNYFKKSPSEILDFTFNKLLTFQGQEDNDEW